MAEWFAPKRYGWGARPVTWQGWVITLAYVAIVIAASKLFDRAPWAAGSMIATATILLLIIIFNNMRSG